MKSILKACIILLSLLPLSLIATLCLAQPPRIAPPLHTEGYRILDSAKHPVRLTSVNWYGFETTSHVAVSANNGDIE